MEKMTSGQRLRTCRACGRKFEYPVKGNEATRNHCADCAILPPDARKVLERLSGRVAQLELAVTRLKEKVFPPSPKP
jgi:hypothetical protein